MGFSSPFDGMIKNMVSASREANPRKESDYVGDDGFLYCGECHTRKETVVTVGDAEYRPYVLCQCQAKKAEREAAEAKAKASADRIDRLRKGCNIPELYREATFENFQQRSDNAAALHIVKRYAEKFSTMLKGGKGLLLHGKVGTGKTYAAACIANRVLDNGMSVYMTSTSDMLRLRDDDSEDQYRSRLFSCSLLVIDDMGAERSTEFGRERVFSYIDGRCSTEKPMVITTNTDFNKLLNPDTQEEARIYDRILKRCFPVTFTGESWRRSEARDGFSEMKAILQGDDDE